MYLRKITTHYYEIFRGILIVTIFIVAVLFPIFYSYQLLNASDLENLQARTERNYYTDEKEATVLYTIDMSKDALVDKHLVARTASSSELTRMEGPSPEGELHMLLAKVTNGSHALKLFLENKDGRIICAASFELVKLPPKPGCEWKIDRGRGGILLHDGKPFFPFGMLVSDSDYQLKEVADAGFNSIIYWQGKDGNLAKIAEMARHYKLNIIFKPYSQTSIKYHPEKLQTIQKYLDGMARVQAIEEMQSFQGIKRIHQQLSRVQRNEILDEFTDIHLPQMIDNITSLKDLSNLIGYYTLDEPNFKYADLDRYLRRIYLETKKVDPYHPSFVLYQPKIIIDSKAVSFADCLGTGPYWTPGRSKFNGSISWLATRTSINVERAIYYGMHPFIIPMSSLSSDFTKRMITPQEQICQTWLALIHGTKGIYYFTHQWVVHKDQWNAFKILASRIKLLAPALTAPSPVHLINYTPGMWAPLKEELPDVQSTLMRFPDGRYALLAANVRCSPVKIDVSVRGLVDSEVRDLFKGKIGPINNFGFTDIIEARGTRTYILHRIADVEPVNITIKITPLGKEGVIEFGYSEEGRKGKKNIISNPSFEESTLAGWPDYYQPIGPRTGWQKRIGEQGAPTGLTDENPFHGNHCIFIEPPVSLAWKIQPKHDTVQSYVLSFYAHSPNKESVKIRLIEHNRYAVDKITPITITGQAWKRYSVCIAVPANIDKYSLFIIQPQDRVCLDAFQFEKGTEPTDFEP